MTDTADVRYRYRVVIESSYPSPDSPEFVRATINRALVDHGLPRWTAVQVTVVMETD